MISIKHSSYAPFNKNKKTSAWSNCFVTPFCGLAQQGPSQYGPFSQPCTVDSIPELLFHPHSRSRICQQATGFLRDDADSSRVFLQPILVGFFPGSGGVPLYLVQRSLGFLEDSLEF